MIKMTFTNSLGESVVIGTSYPYDEPYFLRSVDGLGDVEVENQTQKAPYQDGSTPIDSIIQEREVSITLIIMAEKAEDLPVYRQKLARVFNPKLGELDIIYDDGFQTKLIRGKADSIPVFPSGNENRTEFIQRASISITCFDPYWKDPNPTNVKLEDYVGNFSFPFSFPVTFAIRGDTRVLENNGHVPTPIKVTFNGEAVNPKITKLNTGEFIKVNRTIPQGYSLVITTYFNDKSVVIISPDGQETNAMGYIDLESTFFSLDVGENRLSFITEGGQPEVYIEYRNLFVGV